MDKEKEREKERFPSNFVCSLDYKRHVHKKFDETSILKGKCGKECKDGFVFLHANLNSFYSDCVVNRLASLQPYNTNN